MLAYQFSGSASSLLHKFQILSLGCHLANDLLFYPYFEIQSNLVYWYLQIASFVMGSFLLKSYIPYNRLFQLDLLCGKATAEGPERGDRIWIWKFKVIAYSLKFVVVLRNEGQKEESRQSGWMEGREKEKREGEWERERTPMFLASISSEFYYSEM